MADPNGGQLNRRLEELEKMDQLLLRAQVLQQSALETLQKAQQENDRRFAESDRRHAENEARQKYFDERVDKLVSAIGAFISKMDRDGR